MDIKEIKPLIEKYLDGSTTNEEEETLRTFFSSPRANMPEEWRVYCALFGYEVGQRRSLHTGTDNSQKHDSTKIVDMQPAASPTILRHRHYRWTWAVSVAASVAIIVSLFVGRMTHPRNYAVIDGRVVTNHAVVSDQAEDALQIVSESGEDDFSALKLMQ